VSRGFPTSQARQLSISANNNPIHQSGEYFYNNSEKENTLYLSILHRPKQIYTHTNIKGVNQKFHTVIVKRLYITKTYTS